MNLSSYYGTEPPAIDIDIFPASYLVDIGMLVSVHEVSSLRNAC